MNTEGASVLQKQRSNESLVQKQHAQTTRQQQQMVPQRYVHSLILHDDYWGIVIDKFMACYLDMTSKRVSFKQPRGGRGDNFIRTDLKKLMSLEDSGIDLRNYHGGQSTHHRKMNRGGGRHRSGSPAPQKRLFNSPLSWYRVHVSYSSFCFGCFL